MAVKREQMDRILPKVEIGIVAAYVAVYIIGDILHLRRTVKKAKKLLEKRITEADKGILRVCKRQNTYPPLSGPANAWLACVCRAFFVCETDSSGGCSIVDSWRYG